MNELYVQKLLRLIEKGVITINDIVDLEYKEEVQKRIAA